MSYSILLSETTREYFHALDEKSQRIVKQNLEKLASEPHPKPGAGSGDREKLVVDGQEMFRLHIGRTHTAFYTILEENKEVRIIELLPIDDAHDRYGY